MPLWLLTVGACSADAGDADRGAGDVSDANTAAAPASVACADPRPTAGPGSQVVAVYFACGAAVPGQLHAAYRLVPTAADPIGAALAEMLRGPTDEERALGYRSLFSDRTSGMLNGVERSTGGDTLTIDFADFRDALAESPVPSSFLPGGVMADITWTVFRQFPDVQALRFTFDGDERAFWSWLAGEPAEPRVFTRADWEQV
ncbi:MAG: GerMN domain-containing protein [Longimicrobiales bacterium]